MHDLEFLGTRFGMTFHHCWLILETETGTKSRFQYLCLQGVSNQKADLWATSVIKIIFELIPQTVPATLH